MNTTEDVAHPELRWVAPPEHLDGRPWPEHVPGRRHLEDCPHFTWEGKQFQTVLATPEQLRSLAPCKHCVARQFGQDVGASTDPRHGEPCPTCRMALPLTGICDACG